MSKLLLLAVASYLLGSIPFGYLLYRLRAGQDIRTTGSGNIGATNVFRAAGLWAAAATFALDAGKGYAAVLFADRMSAHSAIAIAIAILCVLAGHCFPIFLKFSGGKGVATGLGAFSAISPVAVLICIVLFAAILVLWRYVSLASIVGSGAFPLVLAAGGERSAPLLIASLAASGLIIARHRGNIHRLRTGTELPIAARRRDGAG
jgi:acyl phosphate:glycerol-3-phosphate acyltransferase